MLSLCEKLLLVGCERKQARSNVQSNVVQATHDCLELWSFNLETQLVAIINQYTDNNCFHKTEDFIRRQ